MRSHPRRFLGVARGATEQVLRAVLVVVRLAPRRHRDAWVLMDRDHQAHDNAEHLFRYLRANRPDINAWFVIRKDCPDWARLSQDGFSDRLVAQGSWQWLVLLLRCKHVVSSHTEEPTFGPPGMRHVRVRELRRPPWTFTFLRHGVTQANLSYLLNPRNIDLLLTNTAAEHESFVGKGSGYRFTAAEVKMTGMPRWDRLITVGRSVASEDRDLVLVAPTWRASLVVRRLPGSQRRELGEQFVTSEYFHSWSGLLGSPHLMEAAARAGVRIGFLPHPNLESILPLMDLPPHVLPLSYSDNDVQTLFARSAALVTDYSSIAFDVAYIDRPVVYFQFDRAAVLEGAVHTFRQGYFEYERDGFGPVTTTVDDAVEAVVEFAGDGFEVPAEYARRIRETFPRRDARCCERVTAAILAMGQCGRTGGGPDHRQGSVPDEA